MIISKRWVGIWSIAEASARAAAIGVSPKVNFILLALTDPTPVAVFPDNTTVRVASCSGVGFSIPRISLMDVNLSLEGIQSFPDDQAGLGY